jgi:acetyl-CoA C-acetyltransferase
VLRQDPDAYALTTALGWYVTKHAVGIYSGRPPERPFAEIDADQLIDRPPPRRATATYEGEATVEAFTVPYNRDGEPEAAVIAALTPDGDRALMRSADAGLIDTLVNGDPLGETITMQASL